MLNDFVRCTLIGVLKCELVRTTIVIDTGTTNFVRYVLHCHGQTCLGASANPVCYRMDTAQLPWVAGAERATRYYYRENDAP